MKKPTIVVVGSVNMDMVATVKNFPRPGETIFGPTFAMFPGGKGANQAVCASRLGGVVRFIGKVGSDVLGSQLAESMGHDGVDVRYLMVDNKASTGIALISVDQTGQNQIIVVSGTNMRLRAADVEKHGSAFMKASVVLTQLESPLEAVEKALVLGKRHGAITILNPAPARKLPRNFLRMVDYLTPNETEAEILSGVPIVSQSSAAKAGREMIKRGVKNVIVTLGARGCLLVHQEGVRSFDGLRVRSVDTTAAGDAFSGSLAYALSKGDRTEEAIEFAVSVSAYSVGTMGAQTSMPTMKEFKRFVAARNASSN